MATQAPEWNNFKNFISELIEQKISCFCRGQANDTWQLQTSFHRLAKITNITLLQYLDLIIPELHYHICAVQNEIINYFPSLIFSWCLKPKVVII